MKTKPLAALLALALACPSSARPSPPTAAQLARLRLGDGFTLTYQVTAHDLRPAALRARQVADAEKATGEALAAGRLPKNMAGYYAVQNAALARPRPNEHFDLTLSARDGRLLYLSNRSGRDQKAGTKSAILLDGDREYEVNGETSAMINNDGWRNAPVYRGENVARLPFCPLPGVGFPGVDLIQNPVRAQATPPGARFTGLVPRLNLIGDPPYRPGEIKAILYQGRLRVVSLAVGPRAVPHQAWHITAFRLMQDHWVGTTMVMTTYENGTPTSEARYRLIEARPEALEAPAFAMDNYLAQGASVFDSAGISISFPYDPKGGTLKEQAAKARAARTPAASRK